MPWSAAAVLEEAASEALFAAQSAAAGGALSLSQDPAVLAAEEGAAEAAAGGDGAAPPMPAPDDWESLCEEGAPLHFRAASADDDGGADEEGGAAAVTAPPMPVLLVNLTRLCGRDLASLCGSPPDYGAAPVRALTARLAAALACDLRARSTELFEARAATHSVDAEAEADLRRERGRAPGDCVVALPYPEEEEGGNAGGTTGGGGAGEEGESSQSVIGLWADSLARTEWPAVNLLKESLARCSQPLHWKSDVAAELQRLAQSEALSAAERGRAQVRRHRALASMHTALRTRLGAQQAEEEAAEEVADAAERAREASTGAGAFVGEGEGYEAGAEEGGGNGDGDAKAQKKAKKKAKKKKKAKGAGRDGAASRQESSSAAADEEQDRRPSQRTYAQLVRVERELLAIEDAVDSGAAAPDEALEECLLADEAATAAKAARAARAAKAAKAGADPDDDGGDDGGQQQEEEEEEVAAMTAARQAADAARDMSLLDMVVATVFDSLPRPAELRTEAAHFEALAARHRELHRLWLHDFGRLPPSARQQAKLALAEEEAERAKADARARAEAEAEEVREAARADADRRERKARGAPSLAMVGGLGMLAGLRDAQAPATFAPGSWGPPS